MNKLKIKSNSGFSILELMVSVTIFTIMLSGAVLLLIYNLESSNNLVNQNQATIIANDGIQLMKSILIDDYDAVFNLAAGGEVDGRITNATLATREFEINPLPEEVIFTYNNGSQITFNRYIKIIEQVPVSHPSSPLSSKLYIESRVTWGNNKELILNSTFFKW